MTNSKRPDLVLRDGSLKASIWSNEGENGPYHSTTLAKTYTDQEGNPRDTSSFSQNDLLRIAELSREAYGAINDLKREQRQEPAHQQPQQDQQNGHAEREAFKEQRREQSHQAQDRSIQR